MNAVELTQLPELIALPLAQFVAFRILGTKAGSSMSNVEVSTITSGWQVFYTYPHVLFQNGFGGPTTPVLGYVPPGNWRFGITKSGRTKLDSTIWPIPPSLHAPTPHKVYLPL
jgi:hypothetical protein